MKLTKKIEISFDFQYLDEDDFKNIEQQLADYTDKEGHFDMRELCSDEDFSAYLEKPYIDIQERVCKIDMIIPYENPSGDFTCNVITFPIKDKYWDAKLDERDTIFANLMNEIIAYLSYLFFLKTDLLNYYIQAGNKKFSIKEIDKITSNQ